MKKICAVLLVSFMLLSVLITVEAKEGVSNNFVASPSVTASVEIESFEYEPVEGEEPIEPDELYLVLTPYMDRETLPEEKKTGLEERYSELVRVENLAEAVPVIETIAETMRVETETLAVTDLFDLSKYEVGEHNVSGIFRIRCDAASLRNFVALLYYDYETESWVAVDDVSIDDTYTVLSFKTDDFGQYAIIVYDTERADEIASGGSHSTSETPRTGDVFPWIALACAAVVAVVFIYNRRKYRA